MILKALAMPRRSIFRFLSFDSTHEIANLTMTRIEYWDSQSLSEIGGYQSEKGVSVTTRQKDPAELSAVPHSAEQNDLCLRQLNANQLK